MPKKRLTELSVEKIKPPAKGKQLDYYDAGMPGLVLRVNYGGAKVWRALYYVKRLAKDGKRTSMPTTYPLGRYPHLNLKEAREKARTFLNDPQKALAEADVGSFKDVAETFIKRHVEANNLRWQDEIKRCLHKYLYPHWQDRAFRDIKRGDVAQLLDVIEDRHGKRQADVVLAIVRKMMNWYATRNDDYVSPIVRGMGRRDANGNARKRILDDAEIRALWSACKDQGMFGSLVKLLLLTAQRRDKVATMRWDHVVEGEWHIASEPREKSNAGTLKLPPLALDIIEAQPRIAGNPHVFAGSMRGRRLPAAFNSFSAAKAKLEAKLSMAPWVLHDLRRTARSLMSRAGVRPDISERVLGHAIAGVEGVYDRYSYDAEKADALLRLARLVESIVNPPANNVVSAAGRFRRARTRRPAASNPQPA
jgi:integrase